MPRHPVLERLRPTAVIDAVLNGSLSSFLELFGETQLLVVRLPTGDEGIASALEATVPVDDAGGLAKPNLVAMSFNTAVTTEIPSTTEISQHTGNFNERALVERLESAEHFVTPLQKRDAADTAFKDRMSVGRAGNKDIVLRHASVSKFHAWFERDELSNLSVTDADSKNGTRLNGAQITPRHAVRVNAGDWVRFGRIETMLCPPETFYNALRTL